MAIVNQSTLPNVTLPVVGTDEYVMCRDGVNLLGVPVTDAANGMPVLKNTAAPNTTTPYLHLTATGTETNIDVAVQPKGTGAFSLQIADNATTGGNKRGANAVDLQTSRTAATQVASGTGSFVAGQNNTASGQAAFALGSGNSVTVNGTANANATAIGLNNTVTVTNTNAVAIGYLHTVTGSESAGIGTKQTVSGTAAFGAGESNTVSGNRACAVAAQSTASGDYSLALTRFATTNGIQGQVAFGHNSDALGRYQTTLTGLRQVTTGTTATRATADGATAATANQLTLRNNSVFKFMGRVVAYDLTTLDAKEWEFSGLIKRGANAAATSLVGTPTVTSQFADTAAASWMVAVSADTTNGALAVTVTGAGANQIRWYVEVFAYETGV